MRVHANDDSEQLRREPAYELNDNLRELALKLATEGPVKTETTPRRVTIAFGDAFIIRTTAALYVWEKPYYPQFYIPRSEIDAALNAGLISVSSVTQQVRTGDDTLIAAIQTMTNDLSPSPSSPFMTFASTLPAPAKALQNMVKIPFDTMGQWYEEDTPIHVHPKDPYKRVDTLACNRPIRITLTPPSSGGKTHLLASSPTSVHLYETLLPRRFYLPLSAFDPAVLRPSETKTQCPYKGEAEYFDVEVGGEMWRDLVWYYRNPTVECAAVAGMCCVYAEKEGVRIELDGEKV